MKCGSKRSEVSEYHLQANTIGFLRFEDAYNIGLDFARNFMKESSD